ncbi:MAG: uroporphyrinogen-III synthase [Nevskia sp.]|nr:uroporphyrinogen-III synthase [Nevskia sp.]
MRSLSGLRVLVTRPAHQSQTLCRLIEEAGGRVLRLPLLAIEPRAAPELAAAVREARADEVWIFTSANAVRAAAPSMGDRWPAQVYAAGQATAAALRDCGCRHAVAPEDSRGAESLLALPALRDLAGRRVRLFTGENALPRLADGLRAAGARVEAFAVYRRVPVAHGPDAVRAALEQAEVAIVSSGEALEHLVRLTPADARARLFALQLALPSARVVEKARELGFAKIPWLPSRVADAAYVELLSKSLPP